MKTLPDFKFKTPALIAVGVVVLVFILLAVAPMFFGANSYKNWLAKKLPKEVAANVHVGKFSLRLLPLPSYTIEGFKLVSSAEPFRGLDIFSAKKIEGNLSLLGLIKGTIETSVRVSGAVMNYRTDGDLSNVALALGLHAGSAQEASSGVANEILPGMKPATDLPFKAMPLPAVENEQAIPSEAPAPAPAVEKPIDKQTRESPSAPVEAEPAPASPTPNEQGPTSLADLIPINSAYALTPFAKESYELIVRSVDFEGAAFSLHEDDNSPRTIISDASLSINNITAGTALVDADQSAGITMSADVRFAGRIHGADAQNLNLSGRIAFDSARKQLGIKNCKGQLVGAPVTFELEWSALSEVPSFDAHFATTALSPAMLIYLRESLRPVLLALGWQGSASADLRAKGTKDSYELTATIDATPSSVAAGRHFSKSAGVPMKMSLSAMAGQEMFSIRECSVSLGEDVFSIQGEWQGGEQQTYSLRVSGDSIDDAILRTHFPVLSNVDVAEEVSGYVAYSLAPSAEDGELTGTLRANKIGFAGIVLDSVEASFAVSAGTVLITPVKGKILGGDFSGSAKVLTGDGIVYMADGVIEGLDAVLIPSIRGLMRGKGSLVLQASTNGPNAAALTSNLSLQGTFVSPQGSFQGMKIASSIFGEDAWKMLEGAAGVLFEDPKKQSISSADESFSDLTAAYELAGANLKISSANWNSSKYSVEGVNGNANLIAGDNSVLRADGTLIVPKSLALQLTPDKIAREKILDKQDRLIVPFTVAGSISSSVCSIDAVKLDAMLASKAPKAKDVLPDEKQQAKGKKATAPVGKTPAVEPPPKEAPAESVAVPAKSAQPTPAVPAPSAPLQTGVSAGPSPAAKEAMPPAVPPASPTPFIPQGPPPTTPESALPVSPPSSLVPKAIPKVPSAVKPPPLPSQAPTPLEQIKPAPAEAKPSQTDVKAPPAEAKPAPSDSGERPSEKDTRVQDIGNPQFRTEAEELMRVMIGQ